MGINKLNFKDLKKHIGHRIECRGYSKISWFGKKVIMINLECIDCNEDFSETIYSCKDEDAGYNIPNGVTLQGIPLEDLEGYE